VPPCTSESFISIIGQRTVGDVFECRGMTLNSFESCTTISVYNLLFIPYRWRLRAGRPEFDYRKVRGRDFFSFTTASRPALGPTRPLLQWVPGALFLGLLPRLMRGAIPPLPQYLLVVWCLIKKGIGLHCVVLN
jgi:hypothetical protein